ncbi:hypothetical protein EXE58_16985 [Nocardioides seonyuensis]|uniref:Uncharacterized protein n=1 Tax=Nocardioides seonyuensis TaxID=2518371 RepID=A0A4P7IKP5_9ACTN|nr:hypothetical protein [Nocardioides seonyuensis]QBX56967.1 hypothetical protein EXE58_16985 [Nocardioides seonyuensis]
MSSPASVSTVLVTLLTVASTLSGCSSDPQEAYCERVADHQDELTEVAASEDEDALFAALPPYRDLQEHAPSDIEDEWTHVVTALEALESAVDGGAEDRIERASEELGSRRTIEAMAALEQHALDVCGTPLAH